MHILEWHLLLMYMWSICSNPSGSVFQDFFLLLSKQLYCRAPAPTAQTGITSTAWHPWRPTRGLFWETLLLACKYPALTPGIICSKIKRRETQALGYVKLLSGTDNGKPTLAGRGNLSLQSVRLYVLIRDRALLVLWPPQNTVNTNCEPE